MRGSQGLKILSKINAAVARREGWTVKQPLPKKMYSVFHRSTEEGMDQRLVIAANYIPFDDFFNVLSESSSNGFVRSLNQWVNTRPLPEVGNSETFTQSMDNIMRQRLILMGCTPILASILEYERLLDYRDSF